MPRSRLPLRSWQSFKVTVPKCSFPLQISLLVTPHCPSKRYYPITPVNLMLSLQEAASPSLGQGFRATQQREPEVCCLFLQCPWSKLLAWRARASCRPSIVDIWPCFSFPEEHSPGACSWVGQETSQRDTEAKHCNSVLLMASTRKTAYS